MTIPTSITDLSTTASSNSPAGGDPPGQGDDFFRAYGSFIATLRDQLNNTANAGTLKNPAFSGSIAGTYNIGGAYTFTTNPAGKIVSAAYIPSATAVANVSAVSVNAAYYIRVGDYVSVSIQCDVSPTVAGGGQFYISLPIASDLATARDAIGGLNGSTVLVSFHGKVAGEPSGDRLDCTFNTTTSAPMAVCVWATYKVI